MKCTGKEWDTCRVEKMGCKGCYYYEDKIAIGIKVSPDFFVKLREQCLAMNGFSNKGLENFDNIKFQGLPIAIDNEIKTDYEIVYDEKPNIEEIIEKIKKIQEV